MKMPALLVRRFVNADQRSLRADDWRKSDERSNLPDG